MTARIRLLSPALLVAACGTALPAFADTWDNSAGNAQWSTATNWADNTEPTINDAVVFPTTIPLNQSTILMTTTEFTSGITFNNDYTLQSGQMFIGPGGVGVAGGRTATINTVINGSSGLTKTGSGTLRLLPTSSNAFSGLISISGFSSTLYVRSNVALGNTANDIDINGGRLQLDGVTSPTFLITGRTITAGALGGTIELLNNAFLDLNTALGANANPLMFTGNGTVELNSTSTRTGSTFVSVPLLRLNNANGLGSPGAAVLSSGAVLEVNNGSGVFTGFVTPNTGTTIRGGTGTHTFDGSANVSGAVSLNGGPASTDTLVLGSNGASVWNNGAGATSVNVGTVQLSSANNYVGDWSINSTLQLNHPGGVGTAASPVVVNPGGVLRLNTTGALARAVTVNSGNFQLSQDALLDANVILNSAQFSGSGRVLSLDDCAMTVNSSNVVAASGFIGRNPGSIGSVVLNGPSLWNMSSNCVAGYSGQGTLLAQTGGDIFSAVTHIGSLPGSTGTATVTGTGTTWTNSGFMGVGYQGTGTLNIQDHANVSTDSTFVGTDPGSHGVVSVDGVGSLWSVAGSPVIGEHGLGQMSITNGGHVSNQTGQVGRMADGTGDVIVTGAGSLWTNASSLTVGGSGDGSLTITTGGRVTSDTCTIGQNTSGDGTVTLTGSGSTMQNNGMTVGFQGEGTLSVLSGAVVTSLGDSSIGNNTTPSGSVVDVSGAGSRWQSTGEVDIGDAGLGLLRIQQGGAATLDGNTFAGLLNGSQGSVVVMDSGSTLDTDALIVGYLGGSGNLTVTSGGHATIGQVSIGNSSGSGTATLEGSGSILDVSGTLELGFNGSGSMNISTGANVSCLALWLGSGAGSTADLSISGGLSHLTCGVFGVNMGGSSSTFSVNGGIVILDGSISDAGSGTTTFILDAGTLDMQNHSIGGSTPIDNAVFRSGTLKNVSQINNGAGLTKTGPDYLYLNTPNTYSGTTTVSEGTLALYNTTGSATGLGLVSIASGGTLAGLGRVSGQVQNAGTVAPAGFVGSPFGTMTIQNSYTQAAGGALNIDIGSTGAFDRLVMTGGSATLAGTLNVSLLNGYSPAPGAVFNILSASSVSGSFSTTSLPPLAGGLAWQVEYQSNAVRLIVVQGCDPTDFNNDGLFPDTADIDDFLSVFSGGPCSTGACSDLDFNNDSLFPDTLDIDSLLSVFSGGPCLM